MNAQLNGIAREVLLPRPTRTPWVAVAGAKGGVGKTTLAVNLAILLQKAGYRTLLVDLDPGCGNVGVHLRLAAPKDLDDAAVGACTPRAAMVPGPGGIHVLLGKAASTTLAGGGPDGALDALLTAIDDLAREFDVVVADTGAGLGPCTLAVAARADLTLSVATPDAAALTDAYALAKVLHLRGRTLPRLVVNRCRNRDEAARAGARLAAVTAKFLGAETRISGAVADDAMLALAVSEQRPLALFGQGQALDDLRALCAAVLGELPSRRRTAVPQPKAAEPAPRLRPART